MASGGLVAQRLEQLLGQRHARRFLEPPRQFDRPSGQHGVEVDQCAVLIENNQFCFMVKWEAELRHRILPVACDGSLMVMGSRASGFALPGWSCPAPAPEISRSSVHCS